MGAGTQHFSQSVGNRFCLGGIEIELVRYCAKSSTSFKKKKKEKFLKINYVFLNLVVKYEN